MDASLDWLSIVQDNCVIIHSYSVLPIITYCISHELWRIDIYPYPEGACTWHCDDYSILQMMMN